MAILPLLTVYQSILELSRKRIAKQFQVSAQEIIFTSCGTGADNLILRSAVGINMLNTLLQVE
jgi:cysteine sulfinate desulfinase/cysteine desulfurase-like protein